MAEKYSTSLSKADLIFRHVDRMSERLNQLSDYSKSSQLLLTYFFNIQHLENILTDCLDKKYKKKKIELFEKVDFRDIGMKPQLNFYFFEQASRWFQLLYMYGSERGIIKGKKAFHSERPDFFSITER